MTGRELTERLLSNIKTSMELRTQIPYLDTLKDLIEGGAVFSSKTLNTSSNFGSFDSSLRAVLSGLHAVNNSIMAPTSVSPLPLTSILTNLTLNTNLLNGMLQDALEDKLPLVLENKNVNTYIISQLESVNAAAV